MEDAARKGWRVFLFGATPNTLHAVAERATALHPELQISGMVSPPFAPMSQWDHEGTLREIRKSRADVVLVALSTPKQELWMARTVSETHALLCGVGAAIDVYAGLQGQAPRWIRGSGLEWAYRLVREPKRLWRRYAMAVPTFVWLLVRRPPSLAKKP